MWLGTHIKRALSILAGLLQAGDCSYLIENGVKIYSAHGKEKYQIFSAFKIDNISACADLNANVHLMSICNNGVTADIHTIHYQPERFPCVYLKPGEGGSIGVFANGKVTFLGAKSVRHLWHMWASLQFLLETSRNAVGSAALYERENVNVM